MTRQPRQPRRNRTANPTVSIEQATVRRYCLDHDRDYPVDGACPECAAASGEGDRQGGER